MSKGRAATGFAANSDGTLLLGATPTTWLDAALADLPTLLLDHAECEKKAAGSALSLVYRYPERYSLTLFASRIAREELRHFEMLNALMRARGIAYRRVTACRYAGALRQLVADHEPARLVDTLLVAAIIEARSWERFGAVATALDALNTGSDAAVPAAELAVFYRRLQLSEARHAANYLTQARALLDASTIAEKLARIAALEWQLISTPDAELRFHSGPPPASPAAQGQVKFLS